MFSERLALALTRLSPTSQLSAALFLGVFLVVAVGSVFVGANPQALGLALVSYLVGSVFAIALMRRGYPHSLLGKGNLVTLFRMAIVAALLAPVIGSIVMITVSAIGGGESHQIDC